MIIKGIKNTVLVIIGSISLILGIIGIFIPVLPTTPLILLSSFCYIRSSKRLYNWLINHKYFGNIIYNYINNKALTKKTKIRALTLLWISLIFSIYIVPKIYLKVLLASIGIGVSIHLIRLNTLPQ